MWTKLTLNINGQIFTASVKHYEEPSDFGINGKKISKLEVRYMGKVVISFERAWELKPSTENERLALAEILKKFN